MLKAIVFAAIGMCMVKADKYDDLNITSYPTPTYSPTEQCTSNTTLTFGTETTMLDPESS